MRVCEHASRYYVAERRENDGVLVLAVLGRKIWSRFFFIEKCVGLHSSFAAHDVLPQYLVSVRTVSVALGFHGQLH